MRIAVAGATGLVGQTLLELLAREAWADHEVIAYATGRREGQTVKRGQDEIKLHALPEEPPAGIDYGLFALPNDVARIVVPRWREAGVRIVDKSSEFRMKPDVPLVVPEVNPEEITAEATLIATPNCTTIPVAVAVAGLHNEFELTDVRVSSYQSVSGAGVAAVAAWEAERAGGEAGSGVPVDRNVIPVIGGVNEDGHSSEEWKLMNELPKILRVGFLPVAATCVRVPVAVGHGMAVEIGLEKNFTLNEALDILDRQEGLTLVRDPSAPPTPRDSAGRDDVLVGRVRLAPNRKNGLLFWVVGDNLRKGAAVNGLQILERWLEV